MRSFLLYSTIFITSFIVVSCSNDISEIIQSPISHNKQYTVLEEIMEMHGKAWLDSLCSRRFQGRRVGTEGHHSAFKFLTYEIEAIGYTPEYQIFETESGVEISNIIVTILGKSDSIIVIGAHYDGAVQSTSKKHYQAANDNASGTVALLMILEQIKFENRYYDKTVICGFWDGEESFEGKTFRGSSYFVEKASYLPQVLYYQNLDTVGHNHDYDNDGLEDICMEYLGNDRIAQMAYTIANNGRFSYHIAESTFFNSDYTPFYKFGIPFINYHDHYNIGCEYIGHSTRDIKDVISIDKLIKLSHNVCESIDSY